MRLLKLILFSLQQQSRMGLWQASAEMVGGGTLRARADAHRELHRQAGMAVRAEVYGAAARGIERAAPGHAGQDTVPARRG